MDRAGVAAERGRSYSERKWLCRFEEIFVGMLILERVYNDKEKSKTNTEYIAIVFAYCSTGKCFAPLYCRKPDEKFAETLKQTEFTSDTPRGERIRCIDDNEEALLWRLRMIGAAKKSIVLATFDLRADESGTDLLAALDQAAKRGVEIKLLIDGIYQQLFLNGSKDFQALAARRM